MNIQVRVDCTAYITYTIDQHTLMKKNINELSSRSIADNESFLLNFFLEYVY